MHLTLCLLCALCNRIVTSLVLEVPQSIQLLSNASNISSSAIENIIQSSPVLTSASYECDKESFGEPTFTSCMDAYAQVPASTQARSHGDRQTQQTYDFSLPLRYASADGTCIIEVFPRIEGGSDLMTPRYLKQSIRYLLRKCLETAHPEGGLAEYLGQANKLSVFVGQLTPNVECFGAEDKPPYDQQCLFDLGRMPVSDDKYVFGEKGTPNIDVALPIRYAESIAHCAIDVLIDGPPVRANWYDIWSSATLVVAMCARFGKSGFSSSKAGETELAIRVTNDAPQTQ